MYLWFKVYLNCIRLFPSVFISFLCSLRFHFCSLIYVMESLFPLTRNSLFLSYLKLGSSPYVFTSLQLRFTSCDLDSVLRAKLLYFLKFYFMALASLIIELELLFSLLHVSFLWFKMPYLWYFICVTLRSDFGMLNIELLSLNIPQILCIRSSFE